MLSAVVTGLLLIALVAELTLSSISYDEDALDRDVWGLVGVATLLFAVGTGIAAFTSLGVLLQLPGLVVLVPLGWYLLGPTSQYDALLYAGIVLGCSGPAVLVSSMFVGVDYPGWRVAIPPRSRLSWRLAGEDGGVRSKPLSKPAIAAIISISAASMVILASFTVYVRTGDVSRLDVGVLADGGRYGSVNFTVYVDGEAIHTGAMVYDGVFWLLEVHLAVELPSGSHKLELDAWNDSSELSVGTIDSWTHVRTLPFTEESAHLSVGVGFV